VQDLFCHSGEPTPSNHTLVAEKSLTRPLYRCVKFEREKKLSFFLSKK
jgi:hypothetical protein